MNKKVNKVIEVYSQSGLNSPAPERFHQWLVDEQFSAEKEDALLRLWKRTEGISTKETPAELESLKRKRQLNATAKKVSPKFTIWKYAAAAAVALLVSLAGAYMLTQQRASQHEPTFAEYFTGDGQTETLTLPDGSTVQTNARTLIVYPADFGKQTRTLYIAGEANFKVVKNPDIPFIVKTKHIAIAALGTEFTVSAYAEDHDAKTTLLSGSIKVTAAHSQAEFILAPGEQFVYNKTGEQYSVQQVDLYDETAWLRGELAFRGATLKEVFDVLERKYAISFQYNASSLSNDKFNFYFKKESSLSEIMSIVTTVAGKFDYTITYK
jgi:ferric-dicitrate binding protein FerR (iron transport regulator)